MSTETDRLAREAEDRRNRLDQTLENLKGRLSPGQVVDELAGYLREGQGADMARNLNRQVRDNPLALGLIGAGAAWLLLGQGVRGEASRLTSQDDGERGYRDGDRTRFVGEVGPVGQRTGTGYSSTSSHQGLGDRVGSAASGVGSAASNAASGIGSGVSSAASSVGDAASNAANRVSGAASDLGESGRRLAHDAADNLSYAADATRRSAADAGRQIGSAGRRIQRSFMDTLQEEPLILGAVALAIGAAIGAALPSTRVEDEWLGDTRDNLRDEALSYGRDAVEKAGTVASHALQAGNEEADRQGLKPSDDGSKPLAEKVGDVVRTAADTARDDARKEGLI